MASKIDLISSALVECGDVPINSLTGNDRRQVVANSVYDKIVENELSKHRWGFARAKAQISLTTGVPIDQEWTSIYQLPSDLVTLIKIYPNIDYQVYGDKIYCNYSQKLTCDYIYNAPESEWPGYFAQVVIYALAKSFSISIRDNASIKQEMNLEYITASRMARYTDSQQHPQTPIFDNPFVNVRY